MPMWIRMERIKEWGKVDKWMRQLLAIFFFFSFLCLGKQGRGERHAPISLTASVSWDQVQPLNIILGSPMWSVFQGYY